MHQQSGLGMKRAMRTCGGCAPRVAGASSSLSAAPSSTGSSRNPAMVRSNRAPASSVNTVQRLVELRSAALEEDALRFRVLGPKVEAQGVLAVPGAHALAGAGLPPCARETRPVRSLRVESRPAPCSDPAGPPAPASHPQRRSSHAAALCPRPGARTDGRPTRDRGGLLPRSVWPAALWWTLRPGAFATVCRRCCARQLTGETRLRSRAMKLLRRIRRGPTESRRCRRLMNEFQLTTCRLDVAHGVRATCACSRQMLATLL
jgi:hypothetical protein